MCGIVGYVGQRQALPILLDGLRRLEYRGYDSAGVALGTVTGALALHKRAGRVSALAEELASDPDLALGGARRGIGHTRWATHGRPSDSNAHPHADEALHVAVVHNGIIENHAELRTELEARGHRLSSETDSEVVAHLVEESLGAGSDLTGAVQAAVRRLRGSFALVVLSSRTPELLVGVRQQTPLVVGHGSDETLLASDIAALLPYTREVTVLQDGEMVVVSAAGVQLLDFSGQPLPPRAPRRIPWDAHAAERGGYAHFMLKEIHEQPAALAESIRGRLGPAGPCLDLGPEGRRVLAEASRATLLA